MKQKYYYFNIPGYSNSSDNHWQSIIEREQKIFVQRINQKDWISVINDTLETYELSQVVLIGHSLGCATIVHWLQKYQKKIKAVVLVAPVDVDSENFNRKINSTGFSPIPLNKIDCFSIVVTSQNDE